MNSSASEESAVPTPHQLIVLGNDALRDSPSTIISNKENFEIRSRKLKDRQLNGYRKKVKNTTQKISIEQHEPYLNLMGAPMCSGRASISRSSNRSIRHGTCSFGTAASRKILSQTSDTFSLPFLN